MLFSCARTIRLWYFVALLALPGVAALADDPLLQVTQTDNNAPSAIVMASNGDSLKNTGRVFSDQGACQNIGAVESTLASRSCPDQVGSRTMIIAEYNNGARECLFIDNFSRQPVSYFVPLRTHTEIASFIANNPADTNVVYGCEAQDVETGCGTTKVRLADSRHGTLVNVDGTGTKKTIYECQATAGCGTWVKKEESGECYADAVCGAATTVYASATPSSNLCSTGRAGAVSFINATSTFAGVSVPSGYWSWGCGGLGGGRDAACIANMPPVNGACGASHGAKFASAPTSALCSAGTATAVSGNNPWSWSCVGHYSGNSTTCQTATNTPICGGANGQTYTADPWSSSLCTNGTAADHGYQSWDGTFYWSCGIGAQKAWCYAFKRTDGVCGVANTETYLSPPTTALCSAGTPSAMSENPHTYQWNCGGTYGGASVTCYARRGTYAPNCGWANGQTFSYRPDETWLCAPGTNISDFVSVGAGWTWYCYTGSGINAHFSACSANNTGWEPPDTGGGGGGGGSGCGCGGGGSGGGGEGGDGACGDPGGGESGGGESGGGESGGGESGGGGDG